jgi:hypothetical protein
MFSQPAACQPAGILASAGGREVIDKKFAESKRFKEGKEADIKE